MNKVKIYEYEKCDTCRKALKFLAMNGVPFERVAICEQPPSRAELRRMLGYLGGDLKKLFNTSGQVYRELDLSTRLPKLSEEQALALLEGNGKLVKRPFVLSAQAGTVGFKEAEWAKIFGLR
ncbi:MAG: arsenate reductase family protein [Deltaproteobacteria bacterium]|nr:arsenate reductase family protein [Deltaproteobacteria bacterium]